VVSQRRLDYAAPWKTVSSMYQSSSPTDSEQDDEEKVEPGKMRVSEIKAELDLRGVGYADCFDKDSLSQRLMEARSSGKANPEILERFNKAKVSQTSCKRFR